LLFLGRLNQKKLNHCLCFYAVPGMPEEKTELLPLNFNVQENKQNGIPVYCLRWQGI
jgi:hypothetical protein